MADKSKALYHTGIPGQDHEKLTPDKGKAENLRRAYDEFEKKTKSDKYKTGTSMVKFSVVEEALKKTSKK